MMKKLIFDTAKAAFKRGFKQFKTQKARAKKFGTPVVPYKMVKEDIKRKIRGTKFTSQAEIKATPGARRRIILRIERAKKAKEKNRKPVIYGKAYASDKKGKTMQIQPLTRKQRREMRKEMAVAADRNYKRVRFKKFGYRSGGIKKERI